MIWNLNWMLLSCAILAQAMLTTIEKLFEIDRLSQGPTGCLQQHISVLTL